MPLRWWAAGRHHEVILYTCPTHGPGPRFSPHHHETQPVLPCDFQTKDTMAWGCQKSLVICNGHRAFSLDRLLVGLVVQPAVATTIILFPPTSLHTADSTKTAGTKCSPSLPCTPANKHACSGHILVASPTCEHPASTTGSGQGHRRVPSRGQSLMMSNRPLRIEAMELSKPEEFPAVPHCCGQTVMIPISPVQSGGPHREEEWCDPDAQTLWL